jgi:catechol 2,3-dioxygenase-like lactoylglutathione lyase family enzyme
MLQARSLTPILRIFDEAKAREFYLDWLGFHPDFEHRFEDGAPLYMGISLGNIRIHLSEHVGDASPGANILIYCKGLVGYHTSITKVPYKYYRPAVEPYQWVEHHICMQVQDPFYNKISFIEDIQGVQ